MTSLTKRPYMTVALLGTAALTLTACGGEEAAETTQPSEWERIQEEGVLTVGTSGTLLATSYRDEESGELTGFEVEVVRELGDRLDLDIEFRELGFDEMLTSVSTGQLDMAANDIEVTEDMTDQFLFSTPIKYSYGTAVVREDDLSGIESLEDLEGKKAAGVSTSVYMQIARDYGAEEVTYDNATNEIYLRDVSIGRTDVILNDYYLSKFGVAAFPELNITIHPDIQYLPSEVGLVVNQDNEELLEQVNETLGEMLSDGTISEISAEFFDGADVSVEPDIEEDN